jgi:uncharacterized SAM-binding protein YcdF (DUF218 family)
MRWLSETVKLFVLPPMGLFVLAAAGWGLLAWRPRLGRLLIVGAMAALYLLSTPLVANSLLRSLETAAPLLHPGAADGAGAIVVLGADVEAGAPEYGGDTVDPLSLVRIRYAAKLHRATGLPVLVTGGTVQADAAPVARVMARALREDFGTLVTWVEDTSRNTHENATFSAALLRGAGITRVYLVTHAWHMPRAETAFEAAGLTVVPAPTDFTPAAGWQMTSFVAGSRPLRRSTFALYEWAGRILYALAY